MKETPRVAFNRHRKTIGDALDSGFTRIAIYDEFKDRLGMGYAMFCRYVKSLELESPPAALNPAQTRRRPKERDAEGAAGSQPGPSEPTAAHSSSSPPPAPAEETSNAERRREPPAAGSFVAGHKDFADEEDIARLNRRAKPKAPNS